MNSPVHVRDVLQRVVRNLQDPPVAKKSPCCNQCSHSVGDLICRGCERTIEEVHDWGAMSPIEQEAAYYEAQARLAARRCPK